MLGNCSSDKIANSYWVAQGDATYCGAEAKTETELQAPTGYTGIYKDWNVDIDGDGRADDPWDFGTSTQYPVLKYCAPKPGIDTADGEPYCPLQPSKQR